MPPHVIFKPMMIPKLKRNSNYERLESAFSHHDRGYIEIDYSADRLGVPAEVHSRYAIKLTPFSGLN